MSHKSMADVVKKAQNKNNRKKQRKIIYFFIAINIKSQYDRKVNVKKEKWEN